MLFLWHNSFLCVVCNMFQHKVLRFYKRHILFRYHYVQSLQTVLYFLVCNPFPRVSRIKLTQYWLLLFTSDNIIRNPSYKVRIHSSWRALKRPKLSLRDGVGAFRSLESGVESPEYLECVSFPTRKTQIIELFWRIKAILFNYTIFTYALRYFGRNVQILNAFLKWRYSLIHWYKYSTEKRMSDEKGLMQFSSAYRRWMTLSRSDGTLTSS